MVWTAHQDHWPPSSLRICPHVNPCWPSQERNPNCSVNNGLNLIPLLVVYWGWILSRHNVWPAIHSASRLFTLTTLCLFASLSLESGSPQMWGVIWLSLRSLPAEVKAALLWRIRTYSRHVLFWISISVHVHAHLQEIRSNQLSRILMTGRRWTNPQDRDISNLFVDWGKMYGLIDILTEMV
jgi:hypothetical protein